MTDKIHGAAYMNGAAKPELSAADEATGAPVVHVSLGVTRKDMAAAAAIVSALIAGGYLFLPAKQQDMVQVQTDIVALKQEVMGLKTGVGELRTATQGLTETMIQLTTAVGELRQTVVVRTRSAPAKPKPAPKPTGFAFP